METQRLTLAIRTIRVLLHIAYGLALGFVFPAFGGARQLRIMQSWSRQLLSILNVHMRVHAQHGLEHSAGQLIVANHISWLDIFVINAITPARFVAKSEVAAWPLIGWMVRRSGTLFIRREYRRDTSRANQMVTNCLRGGERVAVFPQGTSTNGAEPVHFHSAMVQTAIDAQCMVQPLHIRYLDVAGRALTEVAFTGDMTFAASLWQILCVPRFSVAVTYLPKLDCIGSTRRKIARAAQTAVNAIDAAQAA